MSQKVNVPMEIQEAEPPTDKDRFYLAWGLETLKNNIALANDILRQSITLNSTILGAAVIFGDSERSGARVLALLALLLSLAIALIGVLPFENKVDLDSPTDIEIHKRQALRHKRIYLWASAFLLIAGFVMILGEIIVNFFKGG